MSLERLSSAVEYSKAYKRKKLRLRIVAALACFVMFFTTYVLILPATTRERQAFCGFEEHIHTEDCFNSSCSIPEHKHSNNCYVQYGTDIEDSDLWESTLPKELTGDWSKDILLVAKSQLGYSESLNNLGTSQVSNTKGGYTRYGDWYGDPYGNWASMFADFCLYYAGVDKDYFPYGANCEEWVELLDAEKLLYKGGYSPKVGDLVFFRYGNKVNRNKVGIVAELITEGDKLVRIKTIQGDSDNRVAYVEYSFTEESIFGYANLGKAQEEYLKDKPYVRRYSHGDTEITLTYMSSAGIPESAELVIKPVTKSKSKSQYEQAFNTAYKTIDESISQTKHPEITGFRLYDIYFTYQGREIQPTDKIEIKVSFPTTMLSNTAQVSPLRYKESGAIIPECKKSLDDKGNITVIIQTESLSSVAIVTYEEIQSNIISLSPVQVTSLNIQALSGNTFALVSDGMGLDIKNGELTASTITTLKNGVITSNESAVRWSFNLTDEGKYNLSTIIDGIVYYLNLSGSDLVLDTTATDFTATINGNGICLGYNNQYINLSSNGANMFGALNTFELYTAPKGEFTVIFDGRLGNESGGKYSDSEVITKTTDGVGYLTLPTAAEIKAPNNLKLNGWYDIINGVYYDFTMLGASIRVTANTTFYPDWIKETYDIGENKDVVKEQPNTSSFINTYLFDYNELFNTHSAYYNNGWILNEDGRGFILFNNESALGNIGNSAENGDFQWAINKSVIEALFGDTPYIGKTALGEGDWLYSYDKESGYYYFDSSKNSAYYNQSEQRFYLYDSTIKINSSASGGFMPLSRDGNDSLFGMKSEINFYLPYDSGNSKNVSAKGEEMQFRFSGDDDILVFIDGELVLDLFGLQGSAYGEINLATGVVKSGLLSTDGENAISETTLSQIKGGKEHTLTIYYLNRDSNNSNCSIYFNLSPLYLLKLNMKDINGESVSEGTTFKAYSDPECTQEAQLYIKQGDGTVRLIPNGEFTTDENGMAFCWGRFAGETYYIKAISSQSGNADLSKHVIKVTLAQSEDPIMVTIDSNDTQWEFTEEVTYVGGVNHVIHMAVNYDDYVGGDKMLYVEKEWAANSTNLPAEVVMVLYANGAQTSRTLALSAANDWKGFFYELPETDADGNLIEYTVKEEYTKGYTASYNKTTTYVDVEGDTRASGGWSEAGKLDGPGTYIIISNKSNKAISAGNSSSSLATLDTNNTAQQWVVEASGNGYTFKNVGNGKYFNVTSTNSNLSNSAVIFTYTSSSNQLKKQTNNLYLYENSGGSLRGSTRSSYATEFTFMKASVGVEVEGWRVTNTPLPSTVSVPVQKSWDATIDPASYNTVLVDIYLVTIGSESNPVWKGDLNLTAAGNWSASFYNLEYPEEGTYYVVVENTSEYAPSYGDDAVFININGKDVAGARVEVQGTSYAQTVNIKNSFLVLLPATGAGGTNYIVLCGALLPAIAVSMLWYRSRKRKLDKRFHRMSFAKW